MYTTCIGVFTLLQMDKAMKQAKLAEKMTKNAHKAAKGVPEGVNFTQTKDGKILLDFVTKKS